MIEALQISLHKNNKLAKFIINKFRSQTPALYPYLSILWHLLKYLHLSIIAFRILSSLNLLADEIPLLVSPSGNIPQDYLLDEAGGNILNGNRPEQEGWSIHLSSFTPSNNSGGCEVSRLERVKTSLDLSAKEVQTATPQQI